MIDESLPADLSVAFCEICKFKAADISRREWSCHNSRAVRVVPDILSYTLVLYTIGASKMILTVEILFVTPVDRNKLV
jgi:hypothetical protein